MSGSSRVVLCCVAGALALGQSGCNLVPGTWLRQSQMTSRQLHGQNRSLTQQQMAAGQSLAQLQGENQKLNQQLADKAQQLELANKRIGNLEDERTRFASMLDRAQSQGNPLPESANQKFKDLEKRFPGFNFDPETGVSKFSSDVLFDSGSARIKPGAQPLLEQFAKIMSEGEASRLNILVTGHTDDRRISKPATAKDHPTNWHLSTNRANEVVVALGKSGIKDGRMGAAGYGPHQPVAPNTTDANRARNRRVEIFVLAPEANVAGWDQGEPGPQ